MAKGKSRGKFKGAKDPQRSAAMRGNKNADKGIIGVSRQRVSLAVTSPRTFVKVQGPAKFSGSDFAKGFAATAVGGPIGSGLRSYSLAKNNKKDLLAGKGKAVGKVASDQLGSIVGSGVQGYALGYGAAKLGLLTSNPAVALPVLAFAYGATIGVASNKGTDKGLGKKIRFTR